MVAPQVQVAQAAVAQVLSILLLQLAQLILVEAQVEQGMTQELELTLLAALVL
jgi:hypothetical protein